MRNKGLRSLATDKKIFEGDHMEATSRSVVEEHDQSPLKVYTYSNDLTKEKIIRDGVAAAVEGMLNLVSDIAADQDNLIWEHMNAEIVEQNPNAEELTFDSFISLIQKSAVNFDANGKPAFQLITFSPSQPQLIQAWAKNPEYLKRYNALLSSKYKDWLKREEQRVLVD